MQQQDEAIRANYVKAAIGRSQEDPKCRMCKQNNETISHFVSGFPKLEQKEYKKRHDNVAKAVHQDLSENMRLSKVRGGMTMSRTVYLKMRITRCCGT